MKRSHNKDGQAGANGGKVGADAGLPDAMLDAITGGGSHGEVSGQNDSPHASAATEPKPVNDLVGRVVRKDFA